jgi:hypothetical protein
MGGLAFARILAFFPRLFTKLSTDFWDKQKTPFGDSDLAQV